MILHPLWLDIHPSSCPPWPEQHIITLSAVSAKAQSASHLLIAHDAAPACNMMMAHLPQGLVPGVLLGHPVQRSDAVKECSILLALLLLLLHLAQLALCNA